MGLIELQDSQLITGRGDGVGAGSGPVPDNLSCGLRRVSVNKLLVVDPSGNLPIPDSRCHFIIKVTNLSESKMILRCSKFDLQNYGPDLGFRGNKLLYVNKV